MDKLEYLFAAYTVVWLGVLIYTFRLQSEQKRLQRELDTIAAIVEELKR